MALLHLYTGETQPNKEPSIAKKGGRNGTEYRYRCWYLSKRGERLVGPIIAYQLNGLAVADQK